MDDEPKRISITKVLLVLGALAGVFALAQNLTGHGAKSTQSSLTASQVTPLVTGYLQGKGLLNAKGEVLVPTTTASGDKVVTTSTIDNLVKQLLANNAATYIQEYVDANGALQGPQGPIGATGPQGEPGSAVAKGDKGDTGATGPQGPIGDTGAQGPAGQDGADGAVTGVGSGSGLSLVGGILSLKPCTTDQVLIYGSSSWDCGTVTPTGVDYNTTNTSATLTFNSGTLKVAVTDSDGNTITSNTVDLSSTFADKTSTVNSLSTLTSNLSDLATTVGGKADQAAVDSLSTTVSGLSSTVATLATNADLNTLAGRVTTAESDITDLQGSKQDTLTAGTGITLDGMNTLSVTDYANLAKISDLTDFLTADDLSGYVDTAALGTALADYTPSATIASTYATQSSLSSYVTTAGLSTQLANYETTSSAATALAAKADTSVTDGLAARLDTIEGDYLTSSAIANFITMDDVTALGYQNAADVSDALTAALADYTKTSDLDSTYATDAQLSGYTTKTYVDDADTGLQSQINDLSGGGNLTAGNAGNGITIASSVISVNQADLVADGFVKTADLSSYATTDTTALTNYTTTTALGTLLDAKADQSDLATDESNIADLQTAVTNLQNADYQTGTDVTDALSTALSGYATESYVDSAITTLDLGTLESSVSDNTSAIGTLQTDVTALQGAGYITANTTALANYTTTTALNTALGLKADQSDLDSLTTTVGSKASQADLDTLSSSVSSLSTTVAGKQDALTAGDGITLGSGTISVTGYDDLVTTTGLSTALDDYALSTDLSSYETTADLTSKLADLAANSNLNSVLGSYYTSSAVDGLLADKADAATVTALASTVAGKASSSDVTTALAGKQATLTDAANAGTDISIDGSGVISFTNDDGFITDADLPDLSGYLQTSNLDTAITALSKYATTSYVTSQGYLTSSALADYEAATDLDTDVAAAGYIKLSDLTAYSTTLQMNSAISSATTDMATESWVTSQGYALASDLTTLQGTVSGNSSDIADLQSALSSLGISDIAGLQDALDAKADVSTTGTPTSGTLQDEIEALDARVTALENP